MAHVIELLSEVFFPQYLLDIACSSGEVAAKREREIADILCDQVARALLFEASATSAEIVSRRFMDSLPRLKELLNSDVEAMYRADPAARSYAEVVLCYPSIVAMTHHRVAHALHLLEVPILPRMIAEMAHSHCGIDIHPGATIDSHFAIDHGTGVVIGETTIIGKNVVIYQGVTLGAKGFRYDDNGDPINIPRHPIIEDNVRIYSNASILGRIKIGQGSIIGGNIWITQDIAPNSKIVKELVRG